MGAGVGGGSGGWGWVGGGGVQNQKIKISHLQVYCCPASLVSKMGSFVSQVTTVEKIWLQT